MELFLVKNYWNSFWSKNKVAFFSHKIRSREQETKGDSIIQVKYKPMEKKLKETQKYESITKKLKETQT